MEGLRLMGVDDNNHNYSKSTIKVLSRRYFVLLQSLAQEMERKKCSCYTYVQAFEANHMSVVQNSSMLGVKFRNL